MEKKALIFFLILLSSLSSIAQSYTDKYSISGIIVEADTELPLEYASIYAENESNPSIISGSITDEKGFFSFDVPKGNYLLKIDFLGFKTLEIKNVAVTKDTYLGVKKIQNESETLSEVNIIVERSTVDIKLDKKVYNVGMDMIVKGGNAADVLDNVPSITVDEEGAVSLRGNENVKVLIDGKPSGLANNIAEALRTLSAESIEKVEVITNPSARYEAEGGSGIINIVIRKGKAGGVNGSLTGTIGSPKNNRLSSNLNYRGKDFNVYANIGYFNSKSKRLFINNSEYFDTNTGLTRQYIYETDNNLYNRDGYNINYGLDWYLTKSIIWTNNITTNRKIGFKDNPVEFLYYDKNKIFDYTKYRTTVEDSKSDDFEYSTSLEKNFNEDGHKLTINASFYIDNDRDNSVITDQIVGQDSFSKEHIVNIDDKNHKNIKVDYILPLGENSNFEAGYFGDFDQSNMNISFDNMIDSHWVNNSKLSNNLLYKKNVNSLYTQYGSKYNKLNYMIGLRFENTAVNINQLSTNDPNNRNYFHFFPSAFLNYEFSESSNISFSYSRRLNRPRSFHLNPFSVQKSNINFFKGNPYLDPSTTHSLDLGFLKTWTGFTLNSSAYLNKTNNSVEVARFIDGITNDGTPITVNTPINISTEYRYGLEFNINASPYKWWKIDGNFNFFRKETQGDYTYIDLNGNSETLNFDKTIYSYFTRISSKITLPYKIYWQINATYKGPENLAQKKVKANLSANTALSKDVLSGNGTIALNISDIFDSKKRVHETSFPQLKSYSEMQWRGRQINLSFTYRFNQKKYDKRKYENTEKEEFENME